jgi:hypothetical protein
MFLLNHFKRLFSISAPLSSTIVANTMNMGTPQLPRVLILSGSKCNQNYYRDLELTRQTRAVFLAEGYDFASFDWNVSRIAEQIFGGPPDWIFINYIHSYTHRLHGFETLRAPVFGFIGDHYDFLNVTPAAQAKQAFFRKLPLTGLVTAYPHTNLEVLQALGRPNIPVINLPWAIDSEVFRDLKKKRRYDIACMGALTEGKYPFRRLVRTYLEAQNDLKLFHKKRVKGRSGSNHDGDAFNRALNQSRSAFTCASSMQYLLMKYFEIPASGALLFAEQIPYLDAMGFKDGEHYISVTPDNFRERMTHYLNGSYYAEGEVIAKNGHDFVHAHHTWKGRIKIFTTQVKDLI